MYIGLGGLLILILILWLLKQKLAKEGLFDPRHMLQMFGQGVERIAGGNRERLPFLKQPLRDWDRAFSVQIEVDDGAIEVAVVDGPSCPLDSRIGTDELGPGRL